MISHTETNLSRSSHKRFRRALASCLLGLLLALSGSAVFSTDAYAQQRWDYWGGGPAATYRVDLSRNNALCNAVTAALNERKITSRPVLSDSYPNDGIYSDRLRERFPSLYQNPMFVTWMQHALTKREGSFWEPVEWLAIPLYNDGKDVAVVRVTFPGSHGAEQSLVVFDDVEHFEARKWRDLPQLLSDRTGLRLQQPLSTPNYTRWPEIPRVLREKRDWNFATLNGHLERNLIRFAGRVYVFLRDPFHEVAVVSEVHRDKSSREVCFIGSTKDPFKKH